MKTKNYKSIIVIALSMAIMGCNDFKFDSYNVSDVPFVDRESIELFIGTDEELAIMQLISSPADKNFTWVSQNNTVATVTQTGLVTARGEGTTAIVVSSGTDQFLVRVSVRIWVPAETITLDQTEKTVLWGDVPDRFKINALLEPLDNTESDLLVWSSSDESIASVTSEGWVTYIKTGTAIITASARGAQQSLTLNVIMTPEFTGRTDPDFIDRSNWIFPGYQEGSGEQQAGYSSQAHTGEGAAPQGRVVAMIDGNNDTFWHARWTPSATNYPHWFIIDLGEPTEIAGVMIRTRHNSDGSATGFQLFTTDNPVNNLAVLSESAIWQPTNPGRFTHPASRGTERSWALLPPYPVTRYVRVFFGTEYRGSGQYTMIAEFGLYRPRTEQEPDPEP